MHALSRFLARPLLPAVLLGALALPGGQAVALPGLRAAPDAVELELIDRQHAQPLPRYAHAGRQWLAGEPGQAYAVRLRNTTPRRLLVVLSVDGINAIDGRTAAADQAGYVLGPWQALEVAGWRKSLHEVARFQFTDPADSYASRTGRPANVGVIGIAVFGELPAPAAPPPAAIAGEAASAGAAAAPRARRALPAPSSTAQQLGTGHGQREHALAYRTGFQRQRAPLQVTELRYDTPWALAARGIAVHDRVSHGHRPRAFPHSGFVPDPPGE
jgi:hypothetical protein